VIFHVDVLNLSMETTSYLFLSILLSTNLCLHKIKSICFDVFVKTDWIIRMMADDFYFFCWIEVHHLHIDSLSADIV
jgi:hypothetical protein